MNAAFLTTPAGTIGLILVAMTVIAFLEAALPLAVRGRWTRAHLAPNLVLTGLTFATNALFGAALLAVLVRLAGAGFGLLPRLALPAWLEVAVTLVVLDLSFYVTHVAMHKLPALWRFHRVHHSDPAVDVTTTIRQHPGESVIRYLGLGLFACILVPSPLAFAIYRIAVALNGLLEHANVRIPAQLAERLAFVTTWPDLHKVHHTRDAAFTDTNYGNLLSLWDRLFATLTPARAGRSVAYGLDGCDTAATQTTAGLLALPFRSDPGKLAPRYLGPADLSASPRSPKLGS